LPLRQEGRSFVVFIEIEDLKPEPLQVHHVFPIEEIRFTHDDAVLSAPITADFMLTHEEQDLWVEGSVETAIRFRCSRCTKEFSRPFSASFDLSYLPQPKWSAENAEIELRYDEMDVAYYDGIVLDVNLLVLEQLELAIPMNFVCREDCKGLCYKCGADLNEETCPCKSEEPDSRMSALLEFQKNKKVDK
jgi:uncharacterized protein